MGGKRKEVKKSKHVKTIKGKALTIYIVVIIIIALLLSYLAGFYVGQQI